MSRLISDETGYYSPWPPEEDAIIQAHYKKKGARYIHHLLPHRTEKSIGRRASRLGCTTPKRGVKQMKKIKEVPKNESQDEPLITKREEKRNSRSCYGYIPGGPVRSVFELGERA